MSLTTLLSEVVEITRRPDARSRALLALNTLITEIITNQDYPQDLVETSLATNSPEEVNVASLDLPQDVRKIAYVVAGCRQLQSASPQNILDGAGKVLIPDVYYRSGNSLIVRSCQGFDVVRLGYYRRFAGLTEEPGNDSHWLLTEYPAMLLNGTVGRVFMATGDDLSAQYYEGVYKGLRRDIRAGLAEGD